MQEGCRAQLAGQELGAGLGLRNLGRRAKGAPPMRSMALGGALGSVVGGQEWRSQVLAPRERGRAAWHKSPGLCSITPGRVQLSSEARR